MAQHLLARAMQAVFSSFMHGHTECRIHGITLHIQHAHDDNFQVLLPDHTELFRIVGTKRNARIFAV